MQAKLVWQLTGDEIDFAPVNFALLEYYVHQLNQRSVNQFHCKVSKFDDALVTELADSLTTVRDQASRLPIQITNWQGDLFDQDYLNQVHMQWVNTGLQYPHMPQLLRLMQNLDQPFRAINECLHTLESSFQFVFANYETDACQIDNIFGSSLMSFDQPNLTMGFDNLGRSTWNKFLNWDRNVKDTDTNDHQQLSGLIELSLSRPKTYHPPREYVQWCEQQQVPVVGARIGLGNITDLESKLTSIRKIVARNIGQRANTFRIEIV
jgi:hypothetical protein